MTTENTPSPAELVARNTRHPKLFRDADRMLDLILAANGGGDSKGQLKQDIFALAMTGFKRGGYFVEFGATNGVDLSNSHMLETDYGWTGILSEPGRGWHEALHRNRNCHIDTSCIWRETGADLTFHEASEGEYSTISTFTDSDHHAHLRRDPTTYTVQTLSLADLLAKYDAPTHIDLLSIDTEGSEFDILDGFDFGKHSFGLLTVEHNYAAGRQPIRDLLDAKGYALAFDNLTRWDDWYLPKSILAANDSTRG